MSPQDPKVYACLCCRDVGAAIRFLTRAFGFRQLLAVPGDDGAIVHAELSLGSEVIMLGRPNAALAWASPVDGATTACMCVYVGDVDAHCEHARAEGATILLEPHDTSYGTRGYGARDPEGHQWHFGTYRPQP